MVLFVGDSPSKRTHKNVAFRGAACEKRLMEWIEAVTDQNVIIINRIDPDAANLISYCYDYLHFPIVALGVKASEECNHVPHFRLPHPSGRNLQINDQKFIKEQLELCKTYIAQNSISHSAKP